MDIIKFLIRNDYKSNSQIVDWNVIIAAMTTIKDKYPGFNHPSIDKLDQAVLDGDADLAVNYICRFIKSETV